MLSKHRLTQHKKSDKNEQMLMTKGCFIQVVGDQIGCLIDSWKLECFYAQNPTLTFFKIAAYPILLQPYPILIHIIIHPTFLSNFVSQENIVELKNGMLTGILIDDLP